MSDKRNEEITAMDMDSEPPSLPLMEMAPHNPHMLLKRVEELTEQNEALTKRVQRLERSILELTTIQHRQTVNIFESIGSAITGIGKSYQERVNPTHPTKEVDIRKVPDESERNDQTLWLMLIDGQAKAGIMVDGEFKPQPYPAELLAPATEWLIERGLGVDDPVEVNLFVKTRK